MSNFHYDLNYNLKIYLIIIPAQLQAASTSQSNLPVPQPESRTHSPIAVGMKGDVEEVGRGVVNGRQGVETQSAVLMGTLGGVQQGEGRGVCFAVAKLKCNNVMTYICIEGTILVFDTFGVICLCNLCCEITL